jgi:phosphoribosylaminoimidazole-succinocarboxamide synthase
MIDSEEVRKLLRDALGETDLPLPGKGSGKVRDWYTLCGGRRLLVTTDRLSAFDRVLARVPYKGQAINELAAWWFAQTADIVSNHALGVPDPNALVALEAQPFAVEVVVRGYITGVTTTALWYRYALGERDIYGYRFPDGLHKNEPLPEPIITPTTKGGASGHDERLTRAEVSAHGYLDTRTWDEVQAAALALYQRGESVARRVGLILVDTKYEFGRGADGRVLLIDEVHTPDSSRFWKADSYERRVASGEEPENFDKEFVRLAYSQRGYQGDGAPPAVTDDLWVATSQRYIAIYEMLTGRPFAPGAYPVGPRMCDNLRKAGLIT